MASWRLKLLQRGLAARDRHRPVHNLANFEIMSWLWSELVLIGQRRGERDLHFAASTRGQKTGISAKGIRRVQVPSVEALTLGQPFARSRCFTALLMHTCRGITESRAKIFGKGHQNER